VQGAAQELLGHLGAVGVGRVEQDGAQLRRAAQDGHGAVGVAGRAPDPGAGELHRAEAEAGGGKVHGPTLTPPASAGQPIVTAASVALLMAPSARPD
jgi:hypothetical protein